MNRILLNCDMGESFGAWQMGDDAHAMPLVDQANLACGFHAGDPLTIQRSVALAVRHGVSIGAHPAYPDLQGFGRRHLACSAEEVQALVLYQLGALDAFCRAAGTQLAYVKPHGALYNDLLRSDELFEAVLAACARYRPGLPLMVLALADNRREQRPNDRHQQQISFHGPGPFRPASRPSASRPAHLHDDRALAPATTADAPPCTSFRTMPMAAP